MQEKKSDTEPIIYFSEDSEAFEIEAVDRGWRNDVYVLDGDMLFHLNIYTPTRLCQDFETELEHYDYYQMESNVVLVTNSDKDTIIKTILNLHSIGYFDEIKPMDDNNTDSLVKVY